MRSTTMNADADDERLLSVNEVADRLGCTTKTVWKITRERHFPAPLKVGRLTKWRAVAINEWITSRAKAAETERARAARADAAL